MLSDRAADHDLGVQGVAVLANDAQTELAVVQQQGGADGGGLDDLRVRQVHPLGAAGGGIKVQAQRLAGLEEHPPAGEAPHPQLGALHVA